MPAVRAPGGSGMTWGLLQFSGGGSANLMCLNILTDQVIPAIFFFPDGIFLDVDARIQIVKESSESMRHHFHSGIGH